MAGFVRSNKHSGYKENSLVLFIFCVIFVIWTGILLWAGTKQYIASGKLEERVAGMMVETGGITAKKVKRAEIENSLRYWLKISVSRTGTLSYLMKNESHLEKEKKGENIKLIDLGNLVSKKEKSKTKKKSADTLDEKETVMTQNIILFQSGSPDITLKNRTNVSKKSVSESLLCDSNEKLKENRNMIAQLERSHSRSYLLKKFYITDSSTSIDSKIFQVEKLLSMNLTIEKKSEPQILIFHTHGASESFRDSRSGKKSDSIIGVGEKLAEILSDQYGYQVLHDKTEYDRINGKIDRNKAYNNAAAGIEKTLEKYPSIQIIIDLHRDGVGNKVHRTTVIAGKKTAQVMFFNGLSRTSSGDITYLKNDNLQGNLAFSLQLKIECMKRFKDFAKPVYLKGYRYNMHLRKRFTLIELGNENNTLQEAKNAMEPLAMVIDAVLTGE